MVENSTLQWGKCKVVIDDTIVIKDIQTGSTQLNTEQGEKTEAIVEGGEVIAVRYQRNKYTLEFVEFGKASVTHVDGIVAGNHKVKLISCDDDVDKEVFTIPSAVINVQSGFTSQFGTVTTYSCTANRQATGSIVWADIVGTPVITYVGGKVNIQAEEGASIYYTTDGSIPTSASTKYTAPVTIDTSTAAKVVHAIAILDSVSSGVACYNVPKSA